MIDAKSRGGCAFNGREMLKVSKSEGRLYAVMKKIWCPSVLRILEADGNLLLALARSLFCLDVSRLEINHGTKMPG